MRCVLALLLLSLAGCDDEVPAYVAPTPHQSVDADQDGWFDFEECDDADWTVNPSSAEVCDGIDNNCDGHVDEDVTNTWYADEDGDGHGDPDNTRQSCAKPAGHVPYGSDCDDTDSEVRPLASEDCDGIDNNCDGVVDEGCGDDAGWDDDGWDDDGWDDAAWDDDARWEDDGYGDTGF